MIRMRYVLIPAALLLACTAQAGERSRTINAGGGSVEVRHQGETPVNGSGQRIRQARAAGDFSRVIVDDALDAEIAIGPRAAIEIEGDDNLVGRIRTDAESGVLHLRVEGSYRVRQPMVARITLPRLAGVDLRASGGARIRGLTGGTLALVTSGSGDFHADGEVDDLSLEIRGSGTAELDRLRARAARIVINGSGDVHAHVTDALTATVNGSGSIFYGGHPRQVSDQVNGSGRIAPAAR
jgi:hypothetical protein